MNRIPERSVTSAKIGGPSDSSTAGDGLVAAEDRVVLAQGPHAQPARPVPISAAPSTKRVIQRRLIEGPQFSRSAAWAQQGSVAGAPARNKESRTFVLPGVAEYERNN